MSNNKVCLAIFCSEGKGTWPWQWVPVHWLCARLNLYLCSWRQGKWGASSAFLAAPQTGMSKSAAPPNLFFFSFFAAVRIFSPQA